MLSVLSIMPTIQVRAEDYSTGGWNQVETTSKVVNSSGSTVGTVYAGEGVTMLYISGDNAYIEYSASGTAKRGFINKYNLAYYGGFAETAVGRVTTSNSTYYSPSTASRAGSVSAGEYVSVLCNKGGWSYIEYNVSGGLRKRAFIPTSCLHCYSGGVRNSFYHENRLGLEVQVNSNITVYAGPNSETYPKIGTIYTSDAGNVWAYWDFYDGSGRKMSYISYPTSSGEKYGYIYN